MDELREAVATSATLTEVLRKLGLRAAGGNHRSIRSWIDRLEISTAHFTRAAPPRRPATPLGEILVPGSLYRRGTLKERLYAEGLKTRTCEMCGQGELWRGRRMSLILDHVNGVHDDNRLENLRIVCPNCAATLETHCGRNRPDRLTARKCLRCDTPFMPKRGSQRYCSRDCGQRGSGRAGADDGRPVRTGPARITRSGSR
ncbi:MAG: hypothetical protein AB7G37_11625 [Solirubrobacteraceae bacterium]